MAVFAGVVFSVAATVHGLCGFGFSMITVGALSLLIGPKLAVSLVCFFYLCRVVDIKKAHHPPFAIRG